ncbi:MAG: gamma-glutamyltransferase family protein [Metallosphaera yellowstonensis]|jgi:gamma-glutamyltranspeptidase/glutathione hydrolase|uniref:Gamma-glutamyltransferase n=1 Tax=Metallosphaera yellowstonensis MK1 TaxID=671065 RepID=H2C5Z8_9CREN|nr:gamma-glutamyltransferase family protein [Metallosphaera yellowstonensis]EHP69225.1 gamma-glutamyltransferase [Metallosphaera yellowstonensis MK1]
MPAAVGKKIVASQNYVASHVGAKVLENGGNAFDAAIAVSAVLSVVIPHTSGLGGDGMLLAKTPGGVIAYNSTGWAPKNLNVERIENDRGPLTVVVPGLVELWNQMLDYTTMDLRDLLAPAIRLASDGFYVGRGLHHAIINSQRLSREWQGVFGDKRFGDFLQLRKLGRILKEIAKEPRSFYEGRVAELLVTGLKSLGVPVDAEDFSEFRAEKVKLVETQYKDYKVMEFPPNSQGITTLQILKMVDMAGINNYPYNDVRRINEHVRIAGLAYEDRNNFIADPRFHPAPDFLLDKEYLSKRMLEAGIEAKVNESGDTTFFVVADGENEIGMIQSLFYPFGSGLVVEEVVFNNRGFNFTEGKNKPEGRKRPMHTLSIALLEKDSEDVIVGCAGGDLRPQIHSEVIEYYIDYMMEIDEAVNAPRFMFTGNKVIAESRLGVPSTRLEAFSPEVGIVQALKRRKDRYIAVADPRSEGTAIPAV